MPCLPFHLLPAACLPATHAWPAACCCCLALACTYIVRLPACHAHTPADISFCCTLLFLPCAFFLPCLPSLHCLFVLLCTACRCGFVYSLWLGHFSLGWIYVFGRVVTVTGRQAPRQHTHRKNRWDQCQEEETFCLCWTRALPFPPPPAWFLLPCPFYYIPTIYLPTTHPNPPFSFFFSISLSPCFLSYLLPACVCVAFCVLLPLCTMFLFSTSMPAFYPLPFPPPHSSSLLSPLFPLY